ncbi:hypothetical protein ABTY53_12960 [Streptomyces noursei]|uniref:zinc finger domain-containing protein n=1 Tax=Streptomyces noursei TaxID=1971 RepID=UPI00332445C2
MERNEVGALLAYIGRLDPRLTRTDMGEARDQLDQWHDLLGNDVPLVTHHGWDARVTAREYILESPYPIMPVDIARKWRAYRRDRLQRHTDPLPSVSPDDQAAWTAELRGTRRAVATGVAAPTQHRELTGGEGDPELQERLRDVGSCIPPAVRAELAPYRPARAAREAAVAQGQPDVLGVRCEWCLAPLGSPCRRRRIGLDDRARGSAPLTHPHPSRVALAAAQQALQPAMA